MDAVRISLDGVERARGQGFDVAILDTGGRLHIDDDLMEELQAIKGAVQPTDLLFVADVGSPGRGGWEGGGSFGPWNAELRLTYRDFMTQTRIAARPVVIRGATLRADGQSFDLTDGNVLVVHVSPAGSLTITQLPGQRGADEPSQTIVSLIKSALPHDARVQALPLS